MLLSTTLLEEAYHVSDIKVIIKISWLCAGPTHCSNLELVISVFKDVWADVDNLGKPVAAICTIVVEYGSNVFVVDFDGNIALCFGQSFDH